MRKFLVTFWLGFEDVEIHVGDKQLLESILGDPETQIALIRDQGASFLRLVESREVGGDKWKVTEDLLHVPQGLEGLRAIQAALVNDKVEVLLNLHGNRHLDGIERARLHRDLDRLIDVLQGREDTQR